MSKKKKTKDKEKLSKAAKAIAKAEKKRLKQAKKAKEISQHVDEIKRLNRVCGQIDGISKMLNANRKLPDVLTQFKAVHSALSSVEQRIFDTYVTASVEDIVAAEKRKEREAKLSELKTLYKAA